MPRLSAVSRILLWGVVLACGLSARVAPATEIIYDYRMAHDLTAFWDFNGGSPLADKTGNGNTLSLQGGGHTFVAATASGNGWSANEITAATIATEANKVLNIGGGGGLDMPDNYTGGDFSFIVAQKRPTSDNNGNFRTLLASNRFRYQNVANTLQGAINAPGGSFGGSSPLGNNNWYFIALTYNHTTKALNSYAVTNSGTLGSPVLTGSAGGAGGLSDITAMRIANDGLSLIGGPDGFAGEIDFAGFQNGLLTPAQLQLLLDDYVLGPTLIIIPEPGTCVLVALGAVALACRVRRRK